MVSTERINKKYLVKYINDYIVSELDNNNIINYNNIKSHLYKNSSIASLLYKRKNISVYLDNLLKYDKTLKDKLNDINIKLNREGLFTFANPIKSIPFDFNMVDDGIESDVFDESDLENQFCPYIELMSLHGQKNRISYKQSKTNERVLNFVLKSDKTIDGIINHINNIIPDLSLEIKDDNFNLQHNGKQLMNLKTLPNYIDIVVDKNYIQITKYLNKTYPFSFFVFFNIFNFIYLLNKLNYTAEAKYLTIQILDITVNKLIKKYFSSLQEDCTLIVTQLYNTFYKYKIKEMVYDDYKLIGDYYKIYNSNNEGSYITYLVGIYKLFTYLKNKYNREIKNAALELYESRKSDGINRLVEFDDCTRYNQNIKNSETISIDDIYI